MVSFGELDASVLGQVGDLGSLAVLGLADDVALSLQAAAQDLAVLDVSMVGAIPRNRTITPQDITIMEGIFTYASGDTDATDFDVKGSVYAGTNNSSDANVNRNKDLAAVMTWDERGWKRSNCHRSGCRGSRCPRTDRYPRKP